MNQQTNVIDLQHQTTTNARSALDEIVREGARRMLQAAIEEEVAAYINAHQELHDEHGHRLVVRNGHLPEREVLTGAGPLTVKKPRVHDRREGIRFTSTRGRKSVTIISGS